MAQLAEWSRPTTEFGCLSPDIGNLFMLNIGLVFEKTKIKKRRPLMGNFLKGA